MPDNRDDYEPIIATRPTRERLREETQPLWRLVLALGGGLIVVVLLAWWVMGRLPDGGASQAVQTEVSAPEVTPSEVVEQAPAPPAADSEPSAEQPPAQPAPTEPTVSDAQPATPESVPAPVPDTAVPPSPSPSPPASVSLRFTSPDSQVRFEVRGPTDSSPPLTSKVGDVIELAPGTYRVVASGAQLEALERELVLTGLPAEYAVELCAQPEQELESLVGRVIEERVCASADQCESMFNVLSEHADQLVKDSAFRKQQCAKWRSEAAPEGGWTLDTKCDGATAATTCRIEIAQGDCVVTEPRRSVRGGECPRAEFK
jgi:hypothetical protein